MNTKLLSFIGFLLFTAFSSHAAGKLEITVSYERQPGHGSNQYAIWIEDGNGGLVKTLFVTEFTAKGGYVKRPACVPVWVEKANPTAMTEKQIDAFSGATPKSGDHTYTWDLTDESGKTVKPGDYTFVVEATLTGGGSKVVFTDKVNIQGEQADFSPSPKFTSDDEKNKGMIKSVTARFVP